MLYDIRARFVAVYDPPAGSGRQAVRLIPATVPGVQRLVSGLVAFDPPPDDRADHADFWGNAVIDGVWRRDHAQATVTLVARVERRPSGDPLDLSPPLSQLSVEVSGVRDLGAAAPHHFLGASARVDLSRSIADWAAALAGTVGPGVTALTLVRLLGRALHAMMRFDPDATTVETRPEEAFLARHGVCQDYAHILIAALRSVGVPAGYASGFLRTLPPPGAARLEGADAMHAWIRAWVGADMGWVEYDPTNDMMASEDHVLVATGRDYADAAPTQGVLRLSGTQAVRHTVDVVPVG
ncbi:MAG: transglutaminase family protein [Rhodobacteraceae bacterium]|nr:transglutaminase family protein [Paracoccaceae bacterium]